MVGVSHVRRIPSVAVNGMSAGALVAAFRHFFATLRPAAKRAFEAVGSAGQIGVL